MKRLAVVLILGFAVSGCATLWSPLEEGQQEPDVSYKIEFPEGWLKFDSKTSKRMVDPLDRGVTITRDGTMLQNIKVGFMELDQAFLSTKKTLNENMLPQETAEVVVDNFRMAEGVLEFNLLENVPVYVGGHPGFKILFEYKIDNRLWLRRMFYGTILNKRLYFLQYHAPGRYYFERDLETFQNIVDSFRPVLLLE
jgi:hypothetical protein